MTKTPTQTTTDLSIYFQILIEYSLGAFTPTHNIERTNMNQRLLSCRVSTDLKNAFDTVDHDILLDELNHYGFRG